jgi:hypothetical protein
MAVLPPDQAAVHPTAMHNGFGFGQWGMGCLFGAEEGFFDFFFKVVDVDLCLFFWFSGDFERLRKEELVDGIG